MNRPEIPQNLKVAQVDDYHGVQVQDPYRWLEDESSQELARWVEFQRAVTAKYLSGIPFRDELRCRFKRLLEYRRYYDLIRRGPYIFFRKNDGLQKQLVLYVQHGLGQEPEVLIDPTSMAPDGTIRLTSVSPSRNARYLAYGLSHGGSTWEEYRVMDMAVRRDLPERLRQLKASMIAWSSDGFYYSRYPRLTEGDTARSARNENHQVWYHKAGAPQSADTLIHEDQANPLRLHWVQTTEDERFAVLMILDRAAQHVGNALWLLDTATGKHAFTPIVASFDDAFRVIDNQDDYLLVHTNRYAANWRVVAIDSAHPDEKHWKEVIPERERALEVVSVAGSRIFAVYRCEDGHHIYVFDRSGAFQTEVALPGIGLTQVFPGQRGDTDAFWSFTSFTTPPTIYRYDISTQASSVFQQPAVQFNPEKYEVKQVFYPSRDTTQIPMYIVHQKGIQLHGQNPLLLYGYGGNGVSVGPSFDPFMIALLERGVVYAVAGLRGGGEYGEGWHDAGRVLNKQNVFDDCIAAAEWLQSNGYTSKEKCALTGASNGGLLVGAVITQRPDLFKVALPDAGIMDMLRFQKFTLGSAWIAEYGSSDDPALFPALLAYSPLHNVKEGVSYPATLVTTSEHDDHVVPAHSFKFVATLQDRGSGPNPVLIRIGAHSGHGPVNLREALEERADAYAFLLAHVARAS